jgi:hypothetical protein
MLGSMQQAAGQLDYHISHLLLPPLCAVLRPCRTCQKALRWVVRPQALALTSWTLAGCPR